MDWNLTYTKKDGKDDYMKMVQEKKIVGHSRTFYWGNSEHEWPSVHCTSL